jgi:hypothetical protein
LTAVHGPRGWETNFPGGGPTQLSTLALQRLLVLVALVTASVLYGGQLTGPRITNADGLVNVKSCDANANSSSAVDCTLVLNFTIDPGGSWRATITDMAAVVTACDGSASQATCTAGSNTAEFDCPSSCPQNSTYKITVTASAATAMQETFTVLSAGGLTGGTNNGSAVGSITVGLGAPAGGTYGTPMQSGPSVSYPPPQQSMSYSAPPGGVCVGGSVPGPNGCTSIGPLYPSVGGPPLGAYGGAYGGCGGVFGCGAYGGGCLLGPTLCTGAAGCFGGFYGCGGCGFGLTCTSTCMTGSCNFNITTSTKTCLIFGVTFNC